MKKIYASEDNVAIIDSSWCFNRSGICLSFAIPIQVMSVDEIEIYGKEFMKAVNLSYKSIIQSYFYAKNETPIITATHQGEIIMMWSFQGDDNKQTKKALADNDIKEIIYD